MNEATTMIDLDDVDGVVDAEREAEPSRAAWPRARSSSSILTSTSSAPPAPPTPTISRPSAPLQSYVIFLCQFASSALQ